MYIVFILEDQVEKIVNFSENQTVLQVAEENNIPLHGNCEGFGICGSCHVIIENLNDKLPAISDKENDALDNAHGITIKSRLACQIVLNESLNGLRVRLEN
jgi:2Fe-2S ferredoxin